MKTRVALSTIGLVLILVFHISCSVEKKSAMNSFAAGGTKVLVCPTHILNNQSSTYDTNSSQRIVDYINEKQYANASITELTPPPNNEWKSNEAKLLTISIDLASEFVKKSNLPENTFLLYPEFLLLGPNSRVGAVHYCLLNNKGEVAMRGLLNSHWEEFKKVNPSSVSDCVEVFINGFEGKMNAVKP